MSWPTTVDKLENMNSAGMFHFPFLQYLIILYLVVALKNGLIDCPPQIKDLSRCDQDHKDGLSDGPQEQFAKDGFDDLSVLGFSDFSKGEVSAEIGNGHVDVARIFQQIVDLLLEIPGTGRFDVNTDPDTARFTVNVAASMLDEGVLDTDGEFYGFDLGKLPAAVISTVSTPIEDLAAFVQQRNGDLLAVEVILQNVVVAVDRRVMGHSH